MGKTHDLIIDQSRWNGEEILKSSQYDTALGLNMAEDARKLSDGHISEEAFVAKYQESVEKEFQQTLAVQANETDHSGVRWGMVIDLRKCVGCETCTVSCKAENRTPPGVSYNQVFVKEEGTFPNTSRTNIARPCMHCDKPPCASVCPVRATYKADNGIVIQDADRCIGCRYCMVACPYGARTFDFGESYDEMTGYEQVQAPEHGMDRGKREDGKAPVGTVRKCNFCFHRLERGEEPACVETCIGDARYFGDLNDPDSTVSQLAASDRAFRLKESAGTQPRVYYLR
ncbi:sulfate reduction electron transfer complex DsrMKJOP subunit DsrO [Salisediminibacterium halotolerans]|uniref:Prokaryotic molybdopterin-containing oxidoreductase family, iron-sulfur binding subunit n=1 Tax=Salisediminibacterium halotolerans TaxID=517425 RepID=A0A1H9TBI4_9BACI|nr:4Fe-4S dicluster domain-containing protein [Salisediminibacterium haloalkalitolerans]SER94582.1 prokaryotic molybdopterin-containing oxidoreductase family, iron-sulfur binding subunit [Salisediminibacterium haloalkalitolerans]